MKILHFLGIGNVPKRPLIDATGGTERVVLEVARLQAERGASVTVACFASEPWTGTWKGVRLEHLVPFSWAKVRLAGRVWDLGGQLRLGAHVRLNHYDILHLHEHRATRFIADWPKVMHFHNDPLSYVSEADMQAAARHYWQELGRSDAQIAVSGYLARRLREIHAIAGPGAPAANVIVNQSGVHPLTRGEDEQRALRAAKRRELGVRKDDVLFMFAGVVRPEKGIVQLAKAFAKVSATNDRAHLAVAGGSNLWFDGRKAADRTEEEVREALAPAMARGRASMLGIVSPSDLPSLYAGADVLVLPSMFQETFGLVILEAFAVGIPVIGARSGGIPELVRPGETGLIVEQGDIDGLADAMDLLLVDGDLRHRMGANGRRVADQMTWARSVDRIEEIYAKVLHQPHPVPGPEHRPAST